MNLSRCDKMKSVDRAIDLLLCFQTRAQLTVDEMAKTLGWPASSVYRFVHVLRDRGVLAIDPSNRKYRLGPFIHQLGKNSLNLAEFSRPALERLSRESGETSFLSVRSGWETRYAACVEGRERIRFTAPLGRAVPLYAGASGKAILAFMQDDERRSYLQSVRLKGLCTATICDPVALEKRLSLIRERGYDLTQEELYKGAWGLAAPILNEQGVAVASLAITGVIFRSPEKK